jgi:hypothetical protein
MAVPGSGTVVSAHYDADRLTLINLRNAIFHTWNWCRFGIERFQPVRHGTLDDAVIPDDI